MWTKSTLITTLITSYLSKTWSFEVQCGKVDDLSLLTISERINGGEIADIGSWPWQVREGWVILLKSVE